MSNGAAAGATVAAAAAAARARAIKASGAVVRVEPAGFLQLAERSEQPLVVMAEGFWGGFKYLMSYKGLTFFTKSAEALELPADSELMVADKIWIPS